MRELFDWFITLQNGDVIKCNEKPVPIEKILEFVEPVLDPCAFDGIVKKFEIVLHEDN